MPEALAPPEDGEGPLGVVPDAEVLAGGEAVAGAVADDEVLADEEVVAGGEPGLPPAVDELDEPEPQAATDKAINAISRAPTRGRRIDLGVRWLIALIFLADSGDSSPWVLSVGSLKSCQE